MTELNEVQAEGSENQRKIEASDSFNSQLVVLLKEGKYSDLFDLARSSEKAKELGLRLTPSPWSLRITRRLNHDEIREGLNLIGRKSKVDFGRAYEGHQIPIIDIGTYHIVGEGIELPRAFLRGLAEIYAEEWFHVGQELRIANGMPSSLSGLTQDMEIDVAAYLVQKGVKLSEYFLNRNGRREFLKQKKLI